jgi:hypothetical protein
MRRNLLDISMPQALDETCEFQEICGAETAFAAGQCGDSVLRPQVSPAQRNLTLPAFFIEKQDSVFAAVFFAAERLKLTTRQRMKGVGDPKFLGLYSTNACSAMPFPIICGIRDSSRYERTSARGTCAASSDQPLWLLLLRRLICS